MKDTFAANSFKSSSFRSGNWTGVGTSPPPPPPGPVGPFFVEAACVYVAGAETGAVFVAGAEVGGVAI